MSVYRLLPQRSANPYLGGPRIDYQNYFHNLLLDRSGVLWVGTNRDVPFKKTSILQTICLRKYRYNPPD